MSDEARPSSLARLMVLVIDAYRTLLSPWLAAHCRFWPSCSAYARQAVGRHGAWAGAGLTLARLARCHPLARGGVDPVPLAGPRQEARG